MGCELIFLVVQPVNRRGGAEEGKEIQRRAVAGRTLKDSGPEECEGNSTKGEEGTSESGGGFEGGRGQRGITPSSKRTKNTLSRRTSR